ncbi:MAG: hypothetical protein A3E87_10375 [Gammaproteobacteria bacterium RIFCSPHIGHO2_12_FULL_35_23]|nr:MAG: hypothetical protein A3E87_10375 [Gammaproteobacteria bacterium RIFCSPHIGHO2_12_FULL_35_23]
MGRHHSFPSVRSFGSDRSDNRLKARLRKQARQQAEQLERQSPSSYSRIPTTAAGKTSNAALLLQLLAVLGVVMKGVEAGCSTPAIQCEAKTVYLRYANDLVAKIVIAAANMCTITNTNYIRSAAEALADGHCGSARLAGAISDEAVQLGERDVGNLCYLHQRGCPDYFTCKPATTRLFGPETMDSNNATAVALLNCIDAYLEAAREKSQSAVLWALFVLIVLPIGGIFTYYYAKELRAACAKNCCGFFGKPTPTPTSASTTASTPDFTAVVPGSTAPGTGAITPASVAGYPQLGQAPSSVAVYRPGGY